MRHSIPYRYGAILLAAALICLTVGAQGATPQNYDDENTPEGWAWALIKQGKEANFDARCKTPALDPGKDDDRWNDECRRLSAVFISDVLLREPWRSQIPPAGVAISGARIAEDINLKNATLNRPLSLTRSKIDRGIDLRWARTDSLISLDRSRIAGHLSADELRSDSSLWLRGSHFKQNVVLSYAKFEINVDMGGATLEGALNADSLRVGVNLFMRSTETDRASFKDVTLRGATIGGQVSMIGTIVEGTLNADSLHVGASLLMRSDGAHKATFKEVILRSARIDGQVSMIGAIVDGTLNADSLHIGASLLMRSDGAHKATFKGVILRNATIDGQVDMEGATLDSFDAYSLHVGADLFMQSSDANRANFKDVVLRSARIDGRLGMQGAAVEGRLNADSLRVGAQLSMRSTDKQPAIFNSVSLANAQVAGEISLDGATVNQDINAEGVQVGTNLYIRRIISPHAINLTFAHVNGNLDTRGSVLGSLDLSGASIGNVTFGNVLNSSDATAWKGEKDQPGRLNLRNARVGNLSDAPTAWPSQGNLRLAGFTFNHLGGLEEQSGSQMRGRGPAWWDGWLRRDPTYHPSSYEQLAAAFTAAGDRDGADDIRYLSRIRQREETTLYWPRMSSYLFQYTAGFGIGDYTFRVLYWVIGVSLVGGLYLWARVPAARQHGPIWCYGASLSRLLPIIEINREFTDFFNDPERKRLTGRDSLIFSIIAMVGWLLGAILIAAVSGLVPKG
jgi:uncharacterized protein YjbI with pentapeptide repeats